MQHRPNHNLLIWLLALVVAYAPLQGAIAAIDMLGHGNGQASYCQHDMAEQMDHTDIDQATMDHACCQHDGGCNGHCSSCTQCFSTHVMLTGQFNLQGPMHQQFEHPSYLLLKGLFGHSDFRPPRLPA